MRKSGWYEGGPAFAPGRAGSRGKKRLAMLVAVVLVAVVAMSAMFAGFAFAASPQGKTDICHYQAKDETAIGGLDVGWYLLNVSMNSTGKHLAKHGDFVIPDGGTVEGCIALGAQDLR